MSLYNKGKNKWQIEVIMGYDSLGKRKRIYELFNGGKKEAKARENEIKSQIKLGTYIQKNNYKFEQFINKWLDEYAIPNLAPATVHGYKQMQDAINKELGYFKLNELRPLHLIKFYKKLREREIPKKLTVNTILHYYTFINVVLNHAVRWQLLTYNPNERVDRPKLIKKEARHYNIEQAQTLIKSLESENAKYRSLILLALDTGARRGEITGLEWEDVNLDESYIMINKTTQCVGREIIEKSPKNNSSIRKVAITSVTVEALRTYKEEQYKLKEKLGSKWNNSKKVFTTIDGNNMHPDTPSKIFYKILIKHKLPIINFHALRHTSVSLLIALGVHTQAISKRVGHSSVSTTQNIYSHVFDSVANDVANKMNDILNV